MASKLEIGTQLLDDKLTVEFSGAIDEDAQFDAIGGLKANEYVFNFERIQMINSCGVREWINFLEKVDSGAKVTYVNCPQIIVEQMNMVHGFLREGASVESFYAPYFDEDKDEEKKILLKASDVKGGKAPVMKSDSGAELEFDAIEEQYFRFLKK